MKKEILNLLPKLFPHSRELNETEVYLDKPWVLIDSFRSEKLIFRKNGELITVRNGYATLGKWEFITAIDSLIIDRGYEKLLFKKAFLNDSLMVLLQDDSAAGKKTVVFVNEDKVSNLDYEEYLIRYGSSMDLGGKEIGQKYGGGIIFHIDNTGNHGLIAAEQNLPGVIKWANRNIKLPLGIESLTDGFKNTNLIINSHSNTDIYAANACTNYRSGGFTDWFLPAKNQLRFLYDQREVVGNFSRFSSIWSSTGSCNYNLAYGIDFYDGKEVIESFKIESYGTTYHQVRPIRSF